MAFQKIIRQKMLSIAFLLLVINAQSMTNHITKVEILGKKPHQIYDFMFGLDKAKYMSWHPKEHIDFKIIKETKELLGSVFFYHEKMDNITVKYNWEVMELVDNHKIVMKAHYFIPIFLTLTLDETPNGTLVTHDLQIGKKQKKGFLDFCVRNFLFTESKQATMTRHANEEFKNLESLIK
jgi:hypothetical protein